MSNVTYPLDLTGINPSNLITDELHTVSESHFRDYYFIIPNFSPFYVDNFRASVIINNTERELEEDIDFSFALPYVTATRVTGKVLYGGITLHNLDLNGIIKITYQTLGGDHIVDRLYVLSYLADKAYNPRTTIWDIITNKPNAFPPTPHYQDYDNFYGQEELVQALGEIRDAIIQNSSLTKEKIQEFLNEFNSGFNTQYVKKSGDTLTGPLYLAGDPTRFNEAVTKQYVDNAVNLIQSTVDLSNYVTYNVFNTGLATKVDKAGDTLTGYLTLHANPINEMHPATKKYVDSKENLINSQINDLINRVNMLESETATKEYVDSIKNDILTLIYTLFANKGFIS